MFYEIPIAGESGDVSTEMKTNKVTNLDIGAATHTVTIMKKSSFNVSKPTRRRSKESIASSGHWGPTKASSCQYTVVSMFQETCVPRREVRGSKTP